MEIKNLIGLEKPLEKLVETISEGVGVLGNHFFEFDVKKIKRIGKAEAEVEKKKIIARAEGQKEAMAVLDRAGKRFALEQYNKQINLENIFVKTRDDLEGKNVSDNPVEKDWIMRFMDIAQNVSREDIQNILAKILSGEIQQPDSFSYQILEIIKFLSKEDLQTFQKFIALSTDVGVVKLGRNEKESLEKYGLSFVEYLKLASIGLFNQSSTISYDKDVSPSEVFQLDVGNDWFFISNEDKEKPKKFNFGLYIFSNSGIELRPLLINESINEKAEEYKNDFTQELDKKGFKVERRKRAIIFYGKK